MLTETAKLRQLETMFSGWLRGFGVIYSKALRHKYKYTTKQTTDPDLGKGWVLGDPTGVLENRPGFSHFLDVERHLMAKWKKAVFSVLCFQGKCRSNISTITTKKVYLQIYGNMEIYFSSVNRGES